MNSFILIRQFRKDLFVYLPKVKQMFLIAPICFHSFHVYHCWPCGLSISEGEVIGKRSAKYTKLCLWWRKLAYVYSSICRCSKCKDATACTNDKHHPFTLAGQLYTQVNQAGEAFSLLLREIFLHLHAQKPSQILGPFLLLCFLEGKWHLDIVIR